MSSLYLFYLVIMITAALVSVSIAVRVWSSRKINLDASSLILVLSAITLWIIAALLGLLDQDLNHKLLWAKVEYIGVTSVPLLLLGYVLNHFGYHKIITRKRMILLAIIPAATLILAWTNEYHHLIWTEYVPYLDGGLAFSHKIYGAGFWLYWIYSYILLTIATVLTLHLTLRSSKIFRWQSLMILIAILTPWVGNVLYVLHMNPFGELDLTPLAFTITSISLAIGMFRWDLSNFRPVAQEAAIAGMTDGLLFLDDQSRIIDMNPAAQKILNIDIQSSIGKRIEDTFSELLPSYERIDNLGEKSVELKIKSGKESRNFEISDLPFSEKTGNPNGKIVLLHDTTHLKTLEIKLKEMERKHTKALLQQAENKFAVLYQNMPWGVIYWDTDGKVIDMNPAAETILRANIEQLNEMLSKPEEYQMIQEDGSELSPEHFLKILSDSLRTQVNNKVIGVFEPEEKDFRWVIFSFIPLFRPNEDNPYQIFSTLGDITEPKRAEMRLRESQTTLQEIVNAVSESILLIDLNGNLITINETTAKRLGKPKSELIGKNVLDFIPEDVVNVFRKWVEVAVQEKKPLQFEDEQFGTWIENNLYPIIDEDGVVHEIVIYGRDITNRKKAENAIKASMQEAQQRAKTIYVVNQIGSKITSGLEFDQLMLALYEESKKLWQIDQFYISLYDEETEIISFPFSYLNGEPYSIASRKNHTIIGLTEYILDNLEILYIPDTYLLPEKGRLQRNINDPTRSYIGVPLIIMDHVVGVLSIQSHTPNAYSTEQIQMLELLSTQVAIAIQNAQLFQKANQEIIERKQAETVLRHHLTELEFLYESSLSLSQVTDYENLMHQMILQMEEKLNWPHITIRRCNMIEGTLEMSDFHHKTSSKSQRNIERKLNSRVISVGEGLSGWVAQHGVSVRCDDVDQDPRYLKVIPGLHSGLYVPIKVDDKVEAVISIESEQLEAFTEADERLVTTLAAQAAIKLDNLKLIEDLRKSNEQLFSAYDETIQGWSNALDLRDKETEGHTLRVTMLTDNLARMMHISDENLIHIRRGALLHDIGKMGIPDRILLKPDKLTDDEWVLMRAHPVYAYNLLSKIDFLQPALNIPLYHHERWDGTGYPKGLKGNKIPLEARIFAIVDVYDALTSDRPYRLGWPKERAIEYIYEQAGKHFDPEVVGAFKKFVSNNEDPNSNN